MIVSRICSSSVDTTFAQDSVQAAAQRMLSRNVGALVVVNATNVPIGIVTDRDLAVRVVAEARDAEQTTVREVMSPALHSIDKDADIDEALRLMRSGPCRRLPVVDHVGKLVGILTLDDVLQALATEFRGIDRLLQRESPENLAAEPCVL